MTRYESARDWPTWRKWALLVPIYLIDLSVSWGASCFSPAQKKFQKDFGTSAEVTTLGLSLYVLGLALGPMFLAPLSEYFGRSPVYIVSYGTLLAWLLGTALAPNLGAFLVFRVLGGLTASCTIANLGGTIADLFPRRHTGKAMAWFLWAATCGSPLGYFLFSTIAQSRGWRDVFWALLGIAGGFWLLMSATLLILGETRPKEMRKELTASNLARDLLQRTMTRPFRFLSTEPIVMFAAAYNGFLYGISFLFNDALSLVFSQHRFNTLETGLAFLGIVVGISIGPLTHILFQERFFQRRVAAVAGPADQHAVVPEARVRTAMIAAVTLPISLFWFAWTSLPSVHWIVPILACVLWGWSFYTLILATYEFVVDSYGIWSASALAGVGLVRNLCGAGFPLFANQMYHRLGYEWATSLLAFLAILLLPITFVLYFKGEKLRMKSPFAASISRDASPSSGENAAADVEQPLEYTPEAEEKKNKMMKSSSS
ncbi:MFS general substrate transporter [Acaromyces ingoldii]|uniref:MFS general substrate transporter n=1 Tax=Acaromyces ingoldii TaxID=215250 RepID=A0A316YIF5_9BASI|nr:MFS general substrate transporter [Acaromyces ingoldii]PWN88979.1 MFS general substrate transporter [Acaromyces ingoldii]